LLDGPPLESINDSLALSLSGGDARIGNLSLTAVEAPLIATSYIDVTYPEYLQQSTKTIWGKEQLAYRNGIRLPQGSHIELILETNKPIQRCDLLRVRSNEEAEVAESITQLEQAQPSKTLKLPLGVLDGNLLIEVRLWDDEGLCSTRVQPFVIASITDIAPSVDFVLEGIGTAITEQALLQVRSKITDDYDLKEAWIETIIDEQPTQKTPLAITAQGEANIDIDLKAMRDSGANTPKVGSVLALMVSAADFLPLPDTIHVGKSTPIQLNVVTPDQLLVILERRELAMRARLEQIISELGQLRDLLAVMNRPIEPIQESQNEGDAAPEDPIARQMRLLVLRSQQASAQADKSGGELKGVRSEIGQVLAELIHNRIDSKDRRDRLEQKIQRPLITLLEGSWETFAKGISELELFVSKAAPEDRTRRVEALMLQNNEIIAALTTILNDMIDIQDFNEVIDMVRDMLEDQNQVLEQTKAEQKRRLLEALK
jgi:hypothetical protein